MGGIEEGEICASNRDEGEKRKIINKDELASL